MIKEKFELSVLVNGKPIREYFHNGRFFVEAKNKTEYSLKLKNHSHKKILAIVSVDGIEVLQGKKAADTSSGYVVNPFSSLNIAGYRIDDNNVATFKFTSGEETGDAPSYASLVENNFDEVKAYANPSQNNGVIGVRIWEEKDGKFIPAWDNKTITDFYSSINQYRPVAYNTCGVISWGTGCNITTGRFTGAFYPLMSNYSGYSGPNITISGSGPIVSSASLNSVSNNQTAFNSYFNSSNIFCSTGCAVSTLNVSQVQSVSSDSVSSDPNYIPNFNMGTAWGQKIEDKVVKTKFEKTDAYLDLEIFYLTRDELIKMGVDVENAKKVFVSGFPEAFGKTVYCEQPKNWRK